MTMSAGRKRGSGRGALVAGRGHLKWLDDIRKNLSSENFVKIKRTSLGHLFEFPLINFKGQLFLILLEKLQKSSIKRMCLAFKINKQLCEFGPKEFAIMTGLNFNGPVDTPKSSKFHNSVFNGKHSIFLKDIHKAFNDESKRSGGRSVKTLQLALLYLLFGILLVKDRCSKKIELEYLHLIDDLDQFDKYPWGKVVYEFLVVETHLAKHRLIGLVENQKKLALDVYGFTFPIQIWAYEIMPSLAAYCARPVIDNDQAFPRMMRWRVEKYPTLRYDDINNFFTNTQLDSIAPFEITEEEKSRIDVLGVVVYSDGINQLPDDDNEKESEDILNSTDNELINDYSNNDERLIVINQSAELHRTESVNSRRRKLDFGEDVPIIRVVKKVRPQLSTSEENTAFQVLRRSPRKHPFVPPRTYPQSIPVQEHPNILPVKFSRHTSHEAEHSLTQTNVFTKILATNNEMLKLVRLTHSAMRKLQADMHGHLLLMRRNQSVTNIISDNVKAGDDSEEILRTNVVDDPLNEEVYGSDPVQDNSNTRETGKSDAAEEANASIGDLVHPPHHSSMLHSDFSRIVSSIIISKPSIENCIIKSDSPSKSNEDMEFVDALECLPVSNTITHAGVNKKQYVNRYDLSVVDYTVQSDSPFEEWSKKARLRESKKNEEMRIPHQLLKWADVNWFDDLWDRKGLLRDDHIDVCLNLLLIARKHQPNQFVNGWTIIETSCWEALVSYPLETMSQRMRPYVCGQMPSNGVVAWKDVDNIYGVGHVLTNHWVCYAVSIPKQKITIYDSLSNVNDWNNIKQPFMQFAKNLTYLCKKFAVFLGRENCFPLRDEWDIECCAKAPQQTNNYDCGIMALKYLECMVSGHRILSIDPDRCGIFRHDYCAKIMHVAVELLKTDMEKKVVKKK